MPLAAGLSSSETPDLSEPFSRPGEQDETLPASQTYEVVCVGMCHRPRREGLPVSIVPVCTACALRVHAHLTGLPSRALSAGAQTLTFTFGIPPTPCLWPGSCGGSRNIAKGLIHSQGIWRVWVKLRGSGREGRAEPGRGCQCKGEGEANTRSGSWRRQSPGVCCLGPLPTPHHSSGLTHHLPLITSQYV